MEISVVSLSLDLTVCLQSCVFELNDDKAGKCCAAIVVAGNNEDLDCQKIK